MPLTGIKHYNTRIEVFTDSNGDPILDSPTGKIEPNTEFLSDGVTPDPSYVVDVTNVTNCPIGEYQLQNFFVLLNGGFDSPAACGDTSTKRRVYFNGPGIDPVIGDEIYENYARTTVFVGSGLYWKSGVDWYAISTGGIVTDKGTCP